MISNNNEQQKKLKNRGRILIKCPDQPGIVAALSKFLFDHHANIIESSQYSTDPEGGVFFIRIEFHCPDLSTKEHNLKLILNHLQSVLKWNIALHMATNEKER